MVQQPLKSFQNQQKPGDKSAGANSAAALAAQAKKQKIKLPKFVIKTNNYLKENFCTETEVIGVEIQPDCIKICQAKDVKGKWQIVKLASQQVLNTYSQDALSKNKKLYSKALKELFEKNRITNKNIAVSMPTTTAIIKTISLPLMAKENLDRATRIPSFWQNLVQLSENILEYSIFYRIVRENTVQKEMDILFVACKNSDINIYKFIAEEAGLKVVVADIGCFSINNLSKLKSNNDNSQKVFLKIGRDENYLQVINQGRPFIYDIFIPENEKSYLGEYLEHQTFLQKFVSQLKHIISKHEEINHEKITSVSIISSEVNIDKFTEMLTQRVENIKFDHSDIFESIEFPASMEASDNAIPKSGWAICVGLATRKLNIFDDESKKKVSETINLLPNSGDLVENLRSQFYSKIISAGVGIFAVLFLLFYLLVAVSKYNNSIKEINEFNVLNKQYAKKQKEFDKVSAISGGLNKLVKIKESLLLNQRTLLKSIKEISMKIPEGVWLESISIDSVGKISVTGRSYEEYPIISFSKELDKSGVMMGMYIANIKTVNTESGEVIREFVILGEVNNKTVAQ